MSPNFGPPAGGTTVTVSGKNFFRANSTTSAIDSVVMLASPSNMPLTINSGSFTGNNAAGTFTFNAPAHIAGGPYHIQITSVGGISVLSTADEYEYRNVPVVTAVRWSVGGELAPYVKSGDTVYVYADLMCEANSPILNSVAVSGTAASMGARTCTSATSGYVAVTMPAVTQSMTTQYDIQLTSVNGQSGVVAADKVIYPLTPTVTYLDNVCVPSDCATEMHFGPIYKSTGATAGSVLTGTNFKLSPTGVNLVKTVWIDSGTASVYTVSTTVDTSIFALTIPQLSVGTHTIRVETYGGVSVAYNFEVLAPPTITFPTATMPAYMWADEVVANTGVMASAGLEPFDIIGTSFDSSLSTVSIANVAPKTGGCSYVSATSFANCDINRLNSATVATREAQYDIRVDHPLLGAVTSPNSIRIEQISLTNYNFVGGTQFDCASLKVYDFPTSNPSTYHTALVNDTRNGQKYRVRKLADNRCWTIDNMMIADTTLTTADSNVSSNYTLPNTMTTGSSVRTAPQVVDDIACGYAGITGTFGDNRRISHPHTYGQSASTFGSTDRNGCGYLYNWMAATAGAGTSDLTNTTVTSSMCPKGWILPVGNSTASGTIGGLDIAYGGTGNFQSGSPSQLRTLWSNSGAFSVAASGLYGNGFFSVGSSGILWSSLAYSSPTQAYHSLVAATHIDPAYNGLKSDAKAVRCVMN